MKELIIQSLETKCVLGQIRAHLRSAVFKVVDEQDQQFNTGCGLKWENKTLYKILETKIGTLLAEIIREFMEYFRMDYSLSIFIPECGISPERLNTINFVSSSNCATDYYYCPPPTQKYKYPNLPKFSFGKAKRDTEKKIKTYDYYKLSYDKKTDRENIDKKWSTHIIGGDIGVDNRFADDRKLYYESLSPGPGRYNPDYNYFKYKQNRYGYMGIKIRDDKLRVSTNGPRIIPFTPYNIQYLMGTNQRNILNKSWKFKFNEEKDNKTRNNYYKFFFKEQIDTQNNSKTNSSYNEKED